jgi:hypothetical protein
MVLTTSAEYGGSKHLWNVGQFLPDYTAQHSRIQTSSYFSPSEPENFTVDLDQFILLDDSYASPESGRKKQLWFFTFIILQGVPFQTKPPTSADVHGLSKPMAILNYCRRIPLLQLMNYLKSLGCYFSCFYRSVGICSGRHFLCPQNVVISTCIIIWLGT